MRPVLVVAAAIVALLVLAPAVEAHANAAASYPARGARVASSPTEVWIVFTESVDPATTTLSLVNATLVPFQLGSLAFSDGGHRVTAAVPEPLPGGGYVVKWQTISAVDGHKTFGGVPFGVGGGVPPTDHPVVQDLGLRPDAVIGKTMAFVGLALASGAFAFWYLVLPRGQRKGHEAVVERVGLAAAWLQLGGLLLFAYTQFDNSGLAFRDYFLGTVFGQGLVLRLALAALLVAGFSYAWRAETVPRAAWAAIGAVVLLSYVNYGRFSHTPAFLLPSWVGATADAIHLAAVGTWTGALVLFVAFLHTLPRGEADLAEHLRVVPKRFSDLATTAVVLAGASGLFMVWAVVGFGVRDWLGTAYGRLLALKIGLAILMIFLGGFNKVVYVAQYVKSGGMKTLRAFRANVTREVALAAAVFLLAGMITNISPTYETTGSGGDADIPDVNEQEPIVVSSANYVWTLQFHPGPSLGEETHYMAELLNNATQTREAGPAFLRMVFENTDQPDIGTTEIRANRTAAGTYEVVGAFFTIAGHWVITYEVTSDIAFREQVKVEFDVRT